MRGILRVDPADGAPIWRQIEEGVRRLVASRSIAAGTAVPSVRDLAKELCVNPATVAKAYQRLVDAGHLVVKRVEGTFVADAPPTLGTQDRDRLLEEGALRFATLAVTAGAAKQEAQGALDQAWNAIADRKGGQS